MPIYFKRAFLLNQDSWTAGSGSIGPFTQNGTSAENVRATGTDPFGITSLLWTSVSAGTNTANGGWDTSPITIDKSKLYRASVWVKRTSATSTGTFYFGTNSDVTLKQLGGADAGNPYWAYGLMNLLTQNQWYLFVGHIFPSSYTSTIAHPNTGYWTIGGGRLGYFGTDNIGGYHDLKFAPTSSTMYERNYQYYSTSSSDTLVFFDPRIQLCDGSEGNIQSLLSNDLSNKLDHSTISKDGASLKNQNAYLRIDETYALGTITEDGEWRVYTITYTGSFTPVVFGYTNTIAVEYLLVGAGGGTGYDVGGGGGGGGVITGTTILTGGTIYGINIGGGGPSGSTLATRGTTGTDTVIAATGFVTLTAKGGGGGGAYNANGTGLDGGCGGGGGGGAGSASQAGGNTTDATQGFAGGASSAVNWGSGGGGGAGGPGAAGVSNIAVAGGTPRTSGISGRPIKYGGGGYGNNDSGIVHPTGCNMNGVYVGTYGFGANGTGAPNASPYLGKNGLIILRWKYR